MPDRPAFHQFQAIVTSSDHLTERVLLVRFRLVNPPEMQFTAGQYCTFVVSQSARRSYSIASPSADTTTIDICIDISPGGPGSTWFQGLKIGDEAKFLGPLGFFRLDSASPRKRVFVATGTGIAPFRSMLLTTLEKDSVETSLYWGLRHDDDVYWQKEFADLSAKYPHFHFYLTLSQPSPNWQGMRGRVTAHLFNEKDPRSIDFYLCGSRAMIDEVTTRLTSLSVPKEQIKTELYY